MDQEIGGETVNNLKSNEKLLIDDKPLKQNNINPCSSAITNLSLPQNDEKNTKKQKALQLVDELSETLSEYLSYSDSSNSAKNTVVTDKHAQSCSSSNLELDKYTKENEELRHELKSLQQKIIDLAIQYENLNDELERKKKKEVEQLQSIETSTQSGFSSLWSQSSNDFETTETLSNLTVSKSMSENEPSINRRKELEIKLRSSRNSVKQLSDMNMKWQTYNRTREENVKKLEKKVKEQQQTLDRLQEEINGTGDSNSITFTPIQQAYIDNEYQRIRQMADRFKDQRDATLEDAQRTIAECQRKQEEAEKRASELRKRLQQLERDESNRTVQQSELQTALLVATRSSQQTSRDQQAISSLKEAARQYQEDLRRVSEEYQEIIQQNATLREQLRQRSNFRQTIINSGGVTTMTSGTNSFNIIHGSGHSSDIELD